MKTNVPPYFDYLIEGFHHGQTGRFVHLGHWDSATDSTSEMNGDDFLQAQSRLNKFLLNMAKLENGLAILDAGCGFGGTLEALDKQYKDMQLVGINIDERQLEICRQLKTRNNNTLEWKQADACDLPFPDQSFDRVLCIEAMFHFPSRRQFFLEVSRVLRPGGKLVVSDIVLQTSTLPLSLPAQMVESVIQQGFGPWPDFWSSDADHKILASKADLVCSEYIDASVNTLPSYKFTVSDEIDVEIDSGNIAQRAGAMLKWLHLHQHIRYLYLGFEKI
jgi:MPBQ/MSBQ methyltransferase